MTSHISDRYLLFTCHHFQVRQYGALAGHLRERWGIRTVAWVLGDQDLAAARSSHFDLAINLLGGDPSSNDFGSDEASRRIRQFEKRYPGFRFNRDAILDRDISRRGWSWDRIVQYTTSLIRAIDQALSRVDEEPLLVFGENNRLHYRLMHARLANRKYLHYASSRYWPDRMYWTQHQTFQWPEVVRLYRSFLRNGTPERVRKKAAGRLVEIRNRSRKPSYFAATIPEWSPSVTDAARSFSNYVQSLRTNEWKINPMRRTPGSIFPVSRAIEKGRGEWRKRYFKSLASEKVPGQDYVVYFLHDEPEHVVDYLCGPFRNQLYIIEELAAALPAGVRLSVKENPATVGKRPSAFYKRVNALPGATLIDAEVDSHELIQGAELVTTLAGSAALEAMFYGVPAVVFSSLFIASFQGVYQVEHLDVLPELLDTLILESERRGASRRESIASLSAMYCASTEAIIGPEYSLKDIESAPNLSALAESLEKYRDN